MDLYEQLLRTSYLNELAGEYRPYTSATTNAVQLNGVSATSNTIHIDYAQTTTAYTNRYSEYLDYYWRWSPENDRAEIKRKHKETDEDEPLEVSEEMRRFIEELEKTKKTEGGV